MNNQQQKAVMASLRSKGLLNYYQNLDNREKAHVLTHAGLEKVNFDLSNAKASHASKIANGITMNKLLHTKLSRNHNESMLRSAKFHEQLRKKYKGISTQKLWTMFNENRHSNQDLAGEVHAELSRREQQGQRKPVKYPSSGATP